MAPATSKKKKSTGVARSYTILKKSTINPTKNVSSQGKLRTTTSTGAHLAARVAIKRRTRPSRIYLYRKQKVITYSIRYAKNKDGKVKAAAKHLRSVPVKRKKPSPTKKRKTAKKSKTKKSRTSTAAEINLIKRKLVRLSQRV